jgi:cytoskeletal protein CcmA (bactofilin family)
MGIFGKTTDSRAPETPPARPAAPAGAASPPAATARPQGAACVIGAKTTVKGEVTGDEDVVVDGVIEGQVRISKDLRVAQSGSVRATVEAAAVIVSGEIVGDCSASQRVEIQASGRLTGNIRAPRIVIAEGALFKGNSDMSPRKDERKDNHKDFKPALS